MAASAALPFAVLFAPAVPAHAAGNGNPPGNNGTIKVDGLAFDNGHPNNEPHVDCRFEIDFYGFDQGKNHFAQVTFTAQPPTGKGQELLTDKVFIGEDDQSGGGSLAGLDAHQDYDLTTALATFTPHPEQGYHVKLTIHADGSRGADVKHKVFWVDGCGPVPAPPAPDQPSTPDRPKPVTHSTPAPPKPGSPGTPVLPDREENPPVNRASKPEGKTEVKGAVLIRTDSELPRTGIGSLPLTALGLALIAAGGTVRLATRRRAS